MVRPNLPSPSPSIRTPPATSSPPSWLSHRSAAFLSSPPRHHQTTESRRRPPSAFIPPATHASSHTKRVARSSSTRSRIRRRHRNPRTGGFFGNRKRSTMSATAGDEAAVAGRLEALRRKLGKKQHFEEAVADLAATLRDRYAGASPALRESMYSTVCRVATVLQTRYTAPGFWCAGLNLFIGTEKLLTNPSEKEHLKTCILRAREHLDEKEKEESMPSNRVPDSRFLFEGHLTVGQEPPPPAWLVAQNLARELSIVEEQSGDQDGNNSRTELRAGEMPPALVNFLNTISGTGDMDFEAALEASLQGTTAQPKVPPASKEVVANLPVVTVTEEVIARLGSETQCAVCRENLVVDDKMQELPCKHLFHPPCLKPWLDENNSCPICRHELRTDDHAYESRKEREREEEEDRKGAANAVRGGEFMYI